MTTCLIIPPSPFLLDERVFVSLGVLKVAAALEQAGHPVEVLDLSGVKNFVEVARQHAQGGTAQIYGITSTTPQFPAARQVMEAIKEVRPEIVSVLGGPHATLIHAAYKREVKRDVAGRAFRRWSGLLGALVNERVLWDTIVVGDGEKAILEVVRLPGGARVIDADDPDKPMFLTSKNVSEIAWPARHLVDLDSYKYSIDGKRATSLIAQLGCPFGCNFSVTGDTIVFTENGFERIRDLATGVGRAVSCSHGPSSLAYDIGRTVATAEGRQKAPTAIAEGVRPVFKVVGEYGYEIKGTAEHPMLVIEDEAPVWRKISEIKPGDRLVVQTPEVAWPAEYLKLDSALIPELPLGQYDERLYGGIIGPVLTPSLAYLAGTIIGLHTVLEFTAPDTRKHKNLRIPAAILKSPREVLQAFIDGLFSTGKRGGMGAGHIAFKSREFAREVSMALLMLGRPASLTEQRAADECFNGYLVETHSWPERERPGRYYIEVKEIVACLAEPVYDLKVDVEHCFVANGLVAHNCGGRYSPSLRKVRQRGHESVLAEISHLHETYGYSGFMFYDDELNVNPKFFDLMSEVRDLGKRLGTSWALRGFCKSELFTAEQAQVMFEAGFRWVLFGFESASQRILTNMNKRAKKEENTRAVHLAHQAGLKVKALMSIGHAGESVESCIETKEWLISEKPDDFDVTIITTYPGTPYYDDAVLSEPLTQREGRNVWTFSSPVTGDKLHSYEIDYDHTADYYKGIPGEYQSYVFTDHMDRTALVAMRDEIESEVRSKLNIPWNAPHSAAAQFEHTMGQPLTPYLLRTSGHAPETAGK